MKLYDIEVFEANEDFTIQDIDEIVDNFDPDIYGSPVVVGHPKTSSPKFGTAKSLRRVGNSLWSKTELVPEMVEAIRKGLYSERSVRIFRNLVHKGKAIGKYLGHIGFLGGVPPAIKGMEKLQVNYAEVDSEFDDFTEKIEKVVKKKDEEAGMSDYTQAQLDKELKLKEKQMQVDFTEVTNTLKADFEEKISDLEAKVVDFVDSIKTKDTEIAGLKKNIKESDVNDFVDTLIKDEKLLPVDKDSTIALIAKAEELDADYAGELKESYSKREKVISLGKNKDADGKVKTDDETARKKFQEEHDFSDDQMEKYYDKKTFDLAKGKVIK